MPNKPEDKEQPEKIDVEYEYDPDYRLVAANGVFGGVTPRGELRIDFFAEYPPAPGSGEVTYRNKGGKLVEETKKSKDAKLVRRIQVGVLVSPHHIDGFAKWFREKAQMIALRQEDVTGKKVH